MSAVGMDNIEDRIYWTCLGRSSFHSAHCSLPGSSAIMSLLAAPMLSASTRRHAETSDRGPLAPRAGGKEMAPSRTRSQCLPCWYGAEREARVSMNEATALRRASRGEGEAGLSSVVEPEDSGENMLFCLWLMSRVKKGVGSERRGS